MINIPIPLHYCLTADKRPTSFAQICPIGQTYFIREMLSVVRPALLKGGLYHLNKKGARQIVKPNYQDATLMLQLAQRGLYCKRK